MIAKNTVILLTSAFAMVAMFGIKSFAQTDTDTGADANLDAEPTSRGIQRTQDISENLIRHRDRMREIQSRMQDANDEIRMQIQDIRRSNVEVTEENAQKMRDQMAEAREELMRNIEQRRHDSRAILEQKREEIRIRIDRERAEGMQEHEQRRSEFQTKLADIRDEQRRNRAKRLAENINHINEQATEHFLDYLDHLERVLHKIKDRADKATVHGVDIDEVETQIEVALEAIDEVRIKVADQQAEEYIIEIENSEAIRNAYKIVMGRMREDLRLLRDDLRGVFGEVRAVFELLRTTVVATGLKGDEEIEELNENASQETDQVVDVEKEDAE
jgi:DNA repair exonuclease SbcCD ATPase subunit